MYPTLSDLIYDLTGVYIANPIKTFGFFMALAFLLGAFILYRLFLEMEREGKLKSIKEKVLTGTPPNIVEVLGNALLGFVVGYKKETGFKEPPKPPVEEKKKEDSGGKLNDKGILTHLAKAKNIPEAAREGFDKEGLKYQTKSQTEAETVAKAVIEEMGIEDAVLAAEAMKFDGDVNSLIFGEALNQLKEQEDKATTPQAQ